MYNVKKLLLVIGFALVLVKDLRSKYLDGKLTKLELEELKPFVIDLTEFIDDLPEMKSLYDKLPQDQKTILHDDLALQLAISPVDAENAVKNLFAVLSVYKHLIVHLFPTIAPPITE